jgi:hypothetical protein
VIFMTRRRHWRPTRLAVGLAGLVYERALQRWRLEGYWSANIGSSKSTDLVQD